MSISFPATSTGSTTSPRCARSSCAVWLDPPAPIDPLRPAMDRCISCDDLDPQGHQRLPPASRSGRRHRPRHGGGDPQAGECQAASHRHRHRRSRVRLLPGHDQGAVLGQPSSKDGRASGPCPAPAPTTSRTRSGSPRSDEHAHYSAMGYLPQIAEFDASFFRIRPRKPFVIDPKQRLFLQVLYRPRTPATEGGPHRHQDRGLCRRRPSQRHRVSPTRHSSRSRGCWPDGCHARPHGGATLLPLRPLRAGGRLRHGVLLVARRAARRLRGTVCR